MNLKELKEQINSFHTDYDNVPVGIYVNDIFYEINDIVPVTKYPDDGEVIMNLKYENKK